MSTMTEAALRLTLNDGISGLAQAQRRLVSFLAAAGCDTRTLFRVELVIEEVVMNILHHGQPADRRRGAGWRHGRPMAMWQSRWKMTARHSTRCSRLRPLADRLEDATIGGLGLFLVRRYAAGLRYIRTPAGHNRLEVEISRAG